jgi:hypothetical protein
MSDNGSSTDSHRGSSEIERLDEDGNVILAVEGDSRNATRRFVVSSKVLSLASPVFAKLFSPNFSEGAKMMHCSCPEISLHENDPESMSIILAILHHRAPEMKAPDIKSLALLAIHCGKYKCAKALRPWVSLWFGNCGSDLNEYDYSYLILAAHFFRSPKIFAAITKKAQQIPPSGVTAKWAESDIFHMLPETVMSKSFHLNLKVNCLCNITTVSLKRGIKETMKKIAKPGLVRSRVP